MVKAGLQLCFRMSKQIKPPPSMFGWKTLVLKWICHVKHEFFLELGLRSDILQNKMSKNREIALLGCYLWWLEWIIWREVNGQNEHTPCIWAIIWTNYCCLPVEHVIRYWACQPRTFSHTSLKVKELASISVLCSISEAYRASNPWFRLWVATWNI